MNIKQMDAVNAYAQASKQLQQGLSGSKESGAGGGVDSAFSSLVSQSIGDVKNSTANMEVTSAKALVDQADLVDVATAVSNAEMVVETVVTVRDKVIGAYNDILKMPI